MTATYYNFNLDPKEFEVLKQNPDGTVSIGFGKTVVVEKVEVVTKAAAGKVTLNNLAAAPEPPKAVESEKPNKLK